MTYTMAEAAQTVGTSKSTIHRAIKAGRLSATKAEDGTYRIDGAELARVYPPPQAITVEPSPWNVPTHPDTPSKVSLETLRDGSDTVTETPRDGSGTAIETRIAVEVLRARLEAVEAQLTREREMAEAQLRRERETVDDLRKRLDRAEERVLALSAQPAPQAAPAMPQAPPAVVEDLRRRLDETEAHLRALVTLAPPAPQPPMEAPTATTPPPAPQAPQERPSEPQAGLVAGGALRGFLGRLLGLGRGAPP